MPGFEPGLLEILTYAIKIQSDNHYTTQPNDCDLLYGTCANWAYQALPDNCGAAAEGAGSGRVRECQPVSVLYHSLTTFTVGSRIHD